MKPGIVSTVLLSSLCLGSAPVVADSHGMNAAQLAEEKKCLACHAITDSKEMAIAPSLQAIAERYSMDEAERLVQVVLTGGEGHWSPAEMPDMGERADVSRKEAEKLVQWILKRDE